MPKHLNTNRQFMIGNGILAFSVLFVVVIFVYMSLRLSHKQSDTFSESYTIVLEQGFEGERVEIHLNDSVIFDQQVGSIPTQIDITRFAKQSALLFINKETQKINMFNLAEEGGTYTFIKQEESIELLPRD